LNGRYLHVCAKPMPLRESNLLNIGTGLSL